MPGVDDELSGGALVRALEIAVALGPDQDCAERNLDGDGLRRLGVLSVRAINRVQLLPDDGDCRESYAR